MTTIVSVETLPYSPFAGTGTVGIVITNGVSTYIKVAGIDLEGIVSVNWYPKRVGSVKFTEREMILVDSTLGTCMVQVTDNYLLDNDRGGYLSFRLTNGTVITWPVKTFGRVSLGPLWQAPDQGLITG